MRKRFAGLGLYLLMLFLRVKVRLWSIGFQVLHFNRRWFTREVNGNKMFLDFTDKGISRELLYAGIREARATRFLQTLVGPGDVCLDIGSNIGYYALLEARLVGEQGKVLCIEPSQSNIELLQKNIEANGYGNIAAMRAAAGAENTKGRMNLSQSSNRHSFLKADLDLSGETEEVDIVTVDSFLAGKPFPTLIRMDVEGYETEIIHGMKETLATRRPLKLFIEFHCPLLPDAGRELLETLKKEGFSIRALLKEHFSMVSLEPKFFISLHDFLFKKRYHLLNDSFENYDLSIDEFLSELEALRENVFEIFFERK